ncbi:rhodopsin, GQ-coupled-like [Branchiostoma lanceolatum]|uniref:rhodopsin, GQ-coupled-like n=1 Tax=Branchiostoma lanceolatum TaxID=7740 RepID=UPI003451647C
MDEMSHNLTNVSLPANRTDQPELSSNDATMQIIFGSMMLVFGLIGVIGNVVALYAFCSTRKLRRPKNYVVANLCLTDLVMCLVYCPVIVFSSFSNSIPTDAACTMEGFVVGMASIASVGSLVAIAVERFFSITQPMKSLVIVTNRTFLGAVAAVWVYALFLVVPPFFGWGRYVREETKLSCSFDYLSKDTANRAYVITLCILGFGFPLIIIAYCYIRVFTTVKKCSQKRRLMSPNKKSKSEAKTAVNAFIMTTAFCLCWCPYTVVAIIGASGSSVQGTVVFGAALLAKTSVLINPVAYVFSIPSFRKALFGRNKRTWSTSNGPGNDSSSEKRRKLDVSASESGYIKLTVYSAYSSPLSPAASKRLAGRTKSMVDLASEFGRMGTRSHKESWV